MYGGLSIIPIFFSLSIIVGYIKLKAARFSQLFLVVFLVTFLKVNTFSIISLQSHSNSPH